MSDLNQEQQQTQETPTETSPENTVPVEVNNPTETSAQPNSEGGQPEQLQDEKTIEQVEKEKAYFQQSHQDLTQQLKEITATSTPEQEQLPEQQQVPIQPQQPQQQIQQPADWNEFLSNPENMLMAIESQVGSVVQKALSQQNQAFEIRLASKEATRAFGAFCTTNKISDAEITDAQNYVKGLNVQLPPATSAQLMSDRIFSMRSLGKGQQSITDVQAQATQAVKTQMLTTQPDGGSLPPEDNKPKTRHDVVRSKFVKSDQTSALDDLVSGKT